MAIPVITTLNPIEENITFQKTPVSTKFYSSKLLNYVESVEIAGFKKTVLYTEFNTNFNVGDRVFIVNGNYDSGNFIEKDKYTKYTDGYRVLGCDGCRIILDLDYTGDLPYIEDSLDKSIKIYHIKSQREFDYINSITVNTGPISFRDDLNLARTYFIQPLRISKFCGRKDVLGATPSEFSAVLCSDSLIYVNSTTFNGSTSIYNKNNGLSGSGFFLRDDSLSIPTWFDVTSEVLAGRVRAVNPNYSDVEKNLYINGEDFQVGSTEFKQRNTYRYKNSKWSIDIKYKKPYISKLNFRYGTFKGKHKDGIFGTNLKKNNWDSATWTSGAFINSFWNSGIMDSKSVSGEKLYFATLDTNQTTPIQTIDFSNNNGFGYNLLEDSNIFSGEIKNGNTENCNIGLSSNYSAVESYFQQVNPFELKISGFYKDCDIANVVSEKAEISNSYVYNTNIKNTKIVNSQILYSTANSSTFTDEEGINVIAADLWSYNYITNTDNVRGILKLYISEDDVKKLAIGDSFYLTKVNKNLFLSSLSNDEKIKLSIETKYLFDIYSDYELESGKIIVSLKNKNDNKLKVRAKKIVGGYINQFSANDVLYASIDIESRAFGYYESNPPAPSVSILGGGSISSSTPPVPSLIPVSEYFLNSIRPESIDSFFSGTYIRNADFKNGYFDKSTWTSGANINYKHHVIPFDGLNLFIQTVATNSVAITLPLNQLNSSINIQGEDLFVNDIVWLSSIDQVDTNSVKSIEGRYKVATITLNPTFNNKQVILRNLEGLTFSSSATFTTNGAVNLNYHSIHKFRINNSLVQSGLLCRTSINNSNFLNTEFNNQDRILDITNIERLKLINIVFKGTYNTINSGYLFKSHFLEGTWKNGIAYNSIWNGPTFENGVFNSGYWQLGTFQNGVFLNSKDVSGTTQSYDNTASLYRNWLDGTFQNGEFFNSTWMKGTFNNGRLHNSDWYSGIWNNGILGSSNLKTTDTTFGFYAANPQSTVDSKWQDGIVENALVGGNGAVYWYGGKFNNGEFTSFNSISTNESIWYDGQFNNGKFSGLARWKNGKFFKGKFYSYYGNNSVSPINPSTFSTSYSWENGKFFGGEFGNGDYKTNSVWYNGEFSGGIFQGRFWYNGLFTKGDFIGSGSASLIYSSKESASGEFTYCDSFTNSYYGLWYNGFVTDNSKTIKTEERVSTNLVRKVEEERIETPVNFKNMVWLNGTFSHKSGTIQSSLWLKGYFYDGIFDSSIFNPYVDRTFSSNSLNVSFATTQSCVWFNGIFESTLGTGSFYISDWTTGTFRNGYMSGATWKNGVWYYGFADNILWLDGLWKNGNWNGAPFGVESLNTQVNPFEFIDGRSKDIVINVGKNLGNSRRIYLNNVFSASSASLITANPTISSVNQVNSSIYFDPTEIYSYVPQTNSNTNANPFGLNNQSLSLPVDYPTTEWYFGTTFSTENGVITNSHVYTFLPIGDTTPYRGRDPQSSKLFACLSNSNKNVFTQTSRTYIITIQLTVEGIEQVDVFFKVGNKDELRLRLNTNSQRIGQRIFYNPKQYDVTFIYTTPSVFTSDPTEKQFYLRKGNGGIVRVLFLKIEQRDYEYHPDYNNKVYSTGITFPTNEITLPSSNSLEVLGASTDGNLVSISIGNGLFKSGVWENGIWNNGYRSNSFTDEEDVYQFSNIVGLNGVTPYAGKGTYQIDSVTWTVTLQSIQSLQGLNVGDKVSIGNLVAIDINESRKLIKNYFTIKQIDLTNNTIIVELISNFPIIRVEKDSANHLIYVSKNIWLSGAFLNGLFRGIWNNGLFKSYPRIGVMGNSHWVDGKFDGGRFISTKSQTQLGTSYDTGLIQNFIFIDNNQSQVNQFPKYTSWMDLNYIQTEKTTIHEESSLFTLENYITFTYSYFKDNLVETSITPTGVSQLTGFITTDVLESTSTFRDALNVNYTYKLGSKYNIYQNFIPDDGKFIEPFSNNIGFGLNLDNFENNGWYYTDFSNQLSYTFSSNTNNHLYIFPANPIKLDSNVDVESKNRFRLQTNNFFPQSAIVLLWLFATAKFQVRFNRITLNNSNIETIRNRYYVTNLNLFTYSFSPGTWSSPSAGGTFIDYQAKSEITILNGFNERLTPSLTKTQYFFNKKNLDLTLSISSQINEIGSFTTPPALGQYPLPITNNQFKVVFDQISFWEVDMIPFFNYYGNESFIDTRIKTPWYAVAPFIDYSNSNFDFIGNINLTIDSELINNQVNYTVISNAGISGNINTSTGNVSISTQIAIQ